MLTYISVNVGNCSLIEIIPILLRTITHSYHKLRPACINDLIKDLLNKYLFCMYLCINCFYNQRGNRIKLFS